MGQRTSILLEGRHGERERGYFSPSSIQRRVWVGVAGKGDKKKKKKIKKKDKKKEKKKRETLVLKVILPYDFSSRY